MKRRFLVSLLIAAMLISVFGCGKKINPVGPDEPMVTISAETKQPDSDKENLTDDIQTENPETDSQSQNVNPSEGEYVAPVVKILSSGNYRYEDTNDAVIETFHGSNDYLCLVSPDYDRLYDVCTEYNKLTYEQKKQFDDFLDELIADEEEQGEDGIKEAQYCYDSVATYIKRNDSHLFSFLSDHGAYWGGAHGYYESVGYNYAPKDGIRLELCDVVTDMDKASELVIAKIKEMNENDPDMEDGMWEDWESIARQYIDNDHDTWVLTEDGLTYWFGLYILGPYAFGDVWVNIPYEDISEVIKPEYLIPEETVNYAENSVTDGITYVLESVFEPIQDGLNNYSFAEISEILNADSYLNENGYEWEVSDVEKEGYLGIRFADLMNGSMVYFNFAPDEKHYTGRYDDYILIAAYYEGLCSDLYMWYDHVDSEKVIFAAGTDDDAVLYDSFGDALLAFLSREYYGRYGEAR